MLSLHGVLGATLGANVVANNLFLAFLFRCLTFGVHFLKDVGLIRSSMLCCKCRSQIFLCVDTNRKVVYRLRCRKINYASASIRYGSSFQQNNLNFIEVLFLTYYMVRSNKHHREHVAVVEGISQYLQPDGGYIYHLAHYMFAAGCRSHNVDQFKFISIIHTKKSNKIQHSIRTLFHTYMKLNMFRATHHPSSGA